MRLRDKHRVHWRDSGKEPECAPNPEYPDGIDLDVSFGAARACTVRLPYPARRCGAYLVECAECDLTVACSTAGRPDDPRSIKLACKDKPN